jgi:hypothetical protein
VKILISDDLPQRHEGRKGKGLFIRNNLCALCAFALNYKLAGRNVAAYCTAYRPFSESHG